MNNLQFTKSLKNLLEKEDYESANNLAIEYGYKVVEHEEDESSTEIQYGEIIYELIDKYYTIIPLKSLDYINVRFIIK